MLKQKVNNGWGGVGDEIVCVVKRARPISAAAASSSTAVKVRRGDVRRALIVRTRKTVRRPDGRMVRFDDNAAVLLNNKRELLGTRIGGIVSADLRMKGWGKIVSLAPKVRFCHHNACAILMEVIGNIDLPPLNDTIVAVPHFMSHHSHFHCACQYGHCVFTLGNIKSNNGYTTWTVR